MECLLKSYDLLFTIVKRSEFQCVFISFGSAVYKEQLKVLFTADLAKFISQLLLNRNMYAIRIESNFLQLVFYPFHPMWVSMSNADNSMTTVHIKVLHAIFIPYV